MKPPRSGECPLDDGVRYGPEVWREVEGVAFCHWDPWILRLALDERGSLDAVEWLFRQRMTDPKHNVDKGAAEAMHLQIVDLRERHAQVQRTPETLLDDEERASQ